MNMKKLECPACGGKMTRAIQDLRYIYKGKPLVVPALDALVTAGANQMNGIDFAIKDSAPLLAQARADAVNDARAKAETYAKAAGVSLGPILSISENGSQGPRPVYMAMPMVRSAKAVPVAAGEESITAEVSIVWEIH